MFLDVATAVQRAAGRRERAISARRALGGAAHLIDVLRSMPDMTEPAETVVSAPPVEVQRAVLVTKLTLGVSLVLSLVAVLNGEPAALLGFFFGLFVIWLVLFLLRRIERGINWARITLLTLTVLGLAMTLLSAPILWDEGPVSFLLFDIPIALLSALAAWWLVTEPARVWFRQVREQPTGARFAENA